MSSVGEQQKGELMRSNGLKLQQIKQVSDSPCTIFPSTIAAVVTESSSDVVPALVTVGLLADSNNTVPKLLVVT